MVTLVEADGDGCQCASPMKRHDLTGINDRFIIDGIITLPIALYGFLVFPNVPATTKAFYLSEEVRLRSRPRLRKELIKGFRNVSYLPAV